VPPTTTHAPTPTAQLHAYLALRTLWQTSPALYVHQRFGAEPTWQQAQILDAIMPVGAKVSVRSGHGIGKSSTAAWVVSWFLETHDFAKVPCTAPSSHQLRDILWGELSKWRRKADELSESRGDHRRFWLSNLFRLINDSLVDPSAHEWGAFARTARKENPEALQGFHATNLLFVLDEASGIVEEVFEAAEGALSTPGARVLMLGNPTRNAGTFADSHRHNRSEYTALHFRSQDSPLVDPGYRDRLVRKWGEGSNVVRVRADGDFPRQEDDILISLELTEPCLTREPRVGEGRRHLGVDVARLGSDRSTLVLRQGSVVEQIKVYARQETMETVGCIVAVLDAWQVDEVDVDVVGLGAGVYDRLAELKRQGRIRCQVVAVNVATRAPRVDHPADAQPRLLRDHLWLAVAQWLREAQPVFCAEDRGACEDLAGELASVGYGFDSQGHLVVEDKDHMRKRLGHSCDLADAPSHRWTCLRSTCDGALGRAMLLLMRARKPPRVSSSAGAFRGRRRIAKHSYRSSRPQTWRQRPPPLLSLRIQDIFPHPMSPVPPRRNTPERRQDKEV
jgi:phage terminase large subunit